MLEEEKLNEVKKDARGTIEADYILKLMNFCAKTARKRRESEINESIAQRREHFKAKEWDEYTNIVSEEMMKNEQATQAIMQEAFDSIGTNMQEFGMAMQGHAQTNMRFQQFIMMAQQGRMPDEKDLTASKKAPKIEK